MANSRDMYQSIHAAVSKLEKQLAKEKDQKIFKRGRQIQKNAQNSQKQKEIKNCLMAGL